MSNTTIIDRQKTHGNFVDFAIVEQNLKEIMRSQDNWRELSRAQQSALEMVQHKIARILTGDPSHVDHWDDIVGYGQRACESLQRSAEPVHADEKTTWGQ